MSTSTSNWLKGNVATQEAMQKAEASKPGEFPKISEGKHILRITKLFYPDPEVKEDEEGNSYEKRQAIWDVVVDDAESPENGRRGRIWDDLNNDTALQVHFSRLKSCGTDLTSLQESIVNGDENVDYLAIEAERITNAEILMQSKVQYSYNKTDKAKEKPFLRFYFTRQIGETSGAVEFSKGDSVSVDWDNDGTVVIGTVKSSDSEDVVVRYDGANRTFARNTVTLVTD